MVTMKGNNSNGLYHKKRFNNSNLFNRMCYTCSRKTFRASSKV